MNFIVHECVSFGTQYDLTNADWSKRAKLDPGEAQIIASMKRCDGRAVGKNENGKTVISCVWFRDGKPPQIRILGRIELAEDRCVACSRTEIDALRFKDQDERILELETELGSKSSERLKIPKCNRGAVLNHDREDQLIMTNCFRHRGEPVSVDKFCRIQARGLPCMFFAELVVGVEGKKT